jgi:hypothetical protein
MSEGQREAAYDFLVKNGLDHYLVQIQRRRNELSIREATREANLDSSIEPRQSSSGPGRRQARSQERKEQEDVTHDEMATKQLSDASLQTLFTCPVSGCELRFMSRDSLARHSIHRYTAGYEVKGKTSVTYQGESPIAALYDDASGAYDTVNYAVNAEAEETLYPGNDPVDDEPGDQPNPRNVDEATSLYGTSMPRPTFLGSMSNRGSPRSPLTSMTKVPVSLASPGTYRTAQSSLASYATAPSGSQPIWQRTGRQTSMPSRHTLATSRRPGASPDHLHVFDELVNVVVTGVLARVPSALQYSFSQASRTRLEDLVRIGLSPITHMGYDVSHKLPHALAQVLVEQLRKFRMSNFDVFKLEDEQSRTLLRVDISTHISHFLDTRSRLDNPSMTSEVFSSQWLMHLYDRGILVDWMQELNWSGKGQHVEYSPESEAMIPLRYERTLGHSQTAVVDSVRCRRIRLARKKITCSRRLRKEDAIVEVEHLLRLQHLHIVRVVGTYTFKKELAILLYPAAEWDLDKYLDDIWDDAGGKSTLGSSRERGVQALITFFGCLSCAIDFIHKQNVKHMDIKPKNILVRLRERKGNRVYIADFGIARAYTSAADAETDSPTSFTRAYAAPEVVHQDKRGFSADIFSLGCVFVEIMATLASCLTLDEAHDERQKLLDLRQSHANPSYYANIDVVTEWYEAITNLKASERRDGAPEWDHGPSRMHNGFVYMIPRMILSDPELRPPAYELKEWTTSIRCSECDSGPEPFEAAD